MCDQQVVLQHTGLSCLGSCLGSALQIYLLASTTDVAVLYTMESCRESVLHPVILFRQQVDVYGAARLPCTGDRPRSRHAESSPWLAVWSADSQQ
jgi:hypothetical protein